MHAFHGGGGVGKWNDVFKRPVLKQSVNERPVEDVTRAGGIRSWDFESRELNQLASIEE
jgi:hypothetical protein